VIWFERREGAEVVLGVSAISLEFLGFGVDSSNQNLSEFIGAIIVWPVAWEPTGLFCLRLLPK
jgi:hypothetical protein